MKKIMKKVWKVFFISIACVFICFVGFFIWLINTIEFPTVDPAIEINSGCKWLYADVIMNNIDNPDFFYDFPDEDATKEERTAYAETLTVYDAIQYWNISFEISDFVYVLESIDGYTKGTIVYKENEYVTNGILSTAQLTESTTFLELYGKR